MQLLFNIISGYFLWGLTHSQQDLLHCIAGVAETSFIECASLKGMLVADPEDFSCIGSAVGSHREGTAEEIMDLQWTLALILMARLLERSPLFRCCPLGR
jgi:hypothetical protein